jgi:hypothetical protein
MELATSLPVPRAHLRALCWAAESERPWPNASFERSPGRRPHHPLNCTHLDVQHDQRGRIPDPVDRQPRAERHRRRPADRGHLRLSAGQDREAVGHLWAAVLQPGASATGPDRAVSIQSFIALDQGILPFLTAMTVRAD